MCFEHFAELVKQNKLVFDELWLRKCLAVNIQYGFDSVTRGKLNELQSIILQKTGESLLVCPPESLHISIAFILNVKDNRYIDKENTWNEIREECFVKLENIACEQHAISISFNKLVATDSAVIVVAPDSGEINELRRRIKQIEPIGKWARNNAEIVHTTLFRYKEKLKAPQIFQEKLTGCVVNIPLVIKRYDVIKELRYPSIETEVLGSFAFKGYNGA